jgi:C_GCAxxG_C_C family probable redox protein
VASGDLAVSLSRSRFLPVKDDDPSFNCAESIGLGVSEALGLGCDALPRIATAFGGGLSRQGRTCGAVIGGLMVIGLAKGRSAPAEAPKPAIEAGAELQSRFLAAFGSVNCRELTGLDLYTKEGQDTFKATHQNERCCAYLDLVARSVVELVS